MKIRLAACAAALATSEAAGPQDASIPTAGAAVGSEIQRGAAAAFDCYLRFSSLRQAAAFSGCIQEGHAVNRQRMGEGYAAFDAGLYFRAAQFIRIKVEVLQQGDPSSNTADLTALLGPLAANYDEARSKFNLSDSDILDVLAGR